MENYEPRILSSTQETVWFDQLMSPEIPCYNIGCVFVLKGDVDLRRISSAITHVIASNDALRIVISDAQTDTTQKFREPYDFELPIIDFSMQSNAKEKAFLYACEEFKVPFNLSGNQLWNMQWIKFSETEGYWFVCFHHLVADGVSITLVREAVIDVYNQLNRLSVLDLINFAPSYSSFINNDQAYLQSKRYDNDRSFWLNEFKSVPEPVFLRKKTNELNQPVGQFTWRMTAETFSKIDTFSARISCSKTHFFMAILAIYFSKISGNRETIVIGMPVHNRSNAEQKKTIGMFSSVIPVVVPVIPSDTFVQSMQTLALALKKIYRHQRFPMAEITRHLRQLSDAQFSLYDISLSVEDFGSEREFEDLESSLIPLHNGYEPQPLTISVQAYDKGEDIFINFNYDHDCFDELGVTRHCERIQEMITQAIKQPDIRFSEKSLVNNIEFNKLLSFTGDYRIYSGSTNIQGRFESQVKCAPSAVAAVYNHQTITYEQLNCRANQVASYLIDKGIKPNSLVGIYADRSIEFLIAIMGILKAGGAYVPIDPSNPKERLAYMVNDSQVSIILSQKHLGLSLSIPDHCQVILIDNPTLYLAYSTKNPEVKVSGDDLAYMIYTSGSTGRPKGALVHHAGALNHIDAEFDLLGFIDEGNLQPVNFLQSAASSSDVSVWQFLAPLVCGGKTVILDNMTNLTKCVELIQKEQVHLIQTAPVVLQFLLDYLDKLPKDQRELSELRWLMTIAEACPVPLINRWFKVYPTIPIMNGFGPSEASDDITYHIMREPLPEETLTVPIGKPIPNMTMYVLDVHQQLQPMGVVGELCVSGIGVGPGYWNNEERTTVSFLPNPFSDHPGVHGDRLYRTGDLGRWREDGSLEFMGRLDNQVKVRGFRVELGEIEAALAKIEGVGDVAVLAHQTNGQENRLAAYIVLNRKCFSQADTHYLRSCLKEILPDYMIPSSFTFLESMPLNAADKIDRQALPKPDMESALNHYVAPQTENEKILCEIWQEVLRVERVGLTDNFFQLGGHSLMAVQIVSKLHQRLDIELPLSALFASPCLTDFMVSVSSAVESCFNKIPIADRNLPLLLSHAQRRLWFIDQMDKQASVAYHVPGGLRLIGPLNKIALKKALDSIVDRHEILRTSFVSSYGEPHQVIESSVDFELTYLDIQSSDLNTYKQLCETEATTSFSLESGPLIRGKLVTISNNEHVLLLTMHHIISDGWSIGVLVKELSSLYSDFARGRIESLPPLSIQYVDFSQWQRDNLKEKLEEQQKYWIDNLAGINELVALPTDYTRPETQDYKGERIDVSLSPKLTQNLKLLCQRQGVTLYMVLLAGWAVVVSRLSSQDNIVIGSPNANRNRAELETLIGFFVNSQAMRIDLSESPTISELLEQVKNTCLSAQQNQDIPFEQVVEAINPPRTMAHSPIFQLMFNWENTPETNRDIGDLTLCIEETDHHMSQFDLSLDLEEKDDQILGTFIYATALFKTKTIKSHWDYLKTMLKAMVSDLSQPVDRVPFLAENDKLYQLTKLNSPLIHYPGSKNIQGRFESQVRCVPNAVAAVYNHQSITYEQLNCRANQVAGYLIEKGTKPNSLVGIYADRSIEFLIAILGILKAGGAYVPLDPSNPKERLAYMVDDSQLSIILSQKNLESSLSIPDHCQIALIDNPTLFKNYSTKDLKVKVAGEDLAYMIYTSGSTGRPKGALVHHAGALNHIDAEFDLLGFIDEHNLQPVNFLQSAASSSDVSVWQFLAPVVCGGKTVILDDMTNLSKCVELIQNEQVHLIQTAPVVLQFLLDYIDKLPKEQRELSELRWLMTIAEACPVPLINRWFKVYPEIPIMNGFGPSEASDDITYHIMREAIPAETLTVPIGKPIPNMTMYVLDTHQQLQPMGVVGELCVSGAGVGPGYWNNEERTAESFLPNPFIGYPDVHGDRLYRTGDLGRWREDGSLEFMGRLDNQVKVRGFRIELGEIEAALAKIKGVGDVAVLAQQIKGQENRLAAYIVLNKKRLPLTAEVIDTQYLRSCLKESLPDYMVPSSFTFLESMPLNAADKIDRQALPKPDMESAMNHYVAPKTKNEKILCEIWQEVLGVERVGLTDNFFQLGGHSLLMITLIERMKSKGLNVEIVTLFSATDLSEVAQQLNSTKYNIEVPVNLLNLEPINEQNEMSNENFEELVL